MLMAMLDFLDPDPTQALFLLVGLVALVVLAFVLWRELQHRSRRYGGGTLAAAVLAGAVVGLLVGITPNLLPFEIGIVLLITSLGAIYRPEQVVKLTGGASLPFRALREGRELQLLVREHGGWSVARRNEEVKERFAALDAFEGPGTERYVGLLRDTLLADPADPAVAAKIEELAAADAELRASLGGRPVWEKELERRAAALEPDAPAAE
jgi:hypothetical protein